MSFYVNAYITVHDPEEIDFDAQLVNRRGLSDPELEEHLDGFMGFVMDSGKREMTQSLYAVMRHLQRVKHHWIFEFDDDDVSRITPWAWRNNAILFFPDSTVRDPALNVLVHPETGEPDSEAQIPFPKDARERKLASEVLLRNRLIDTPESLPPIVSEREVFLRDADEIAWRAHALFIVAVRAESLATNKPIPIDKLREKSPFAFKALSPTEVAFMENDQPDQQSIVNAAWRYEALFTLQWALTLHTSMPFPDEICDVPLVAQTQIARSNREFVADARLRSATEILDALDFNYRLLWAARDAQMKDEQPPGSVDGGVVSERQHALNWMVRFENSEWDDVDIPS